MSDLVALLVVGGLILAALCFVVIGDRIVLSQFWTLKRRGGSFGEIPYGEPRTHV